MEDNILISGVQALYRIKDDLLKQSEFRLTTSEKDALESRLEKETEQKEKEIRDEISNTLKKRKDEISGTFDEQLNLTRNRLKKIKAKKERMKGSKVSERIDDETSDIRDENYQMRTDIRRMFKEKKIPAIFNNNLYYALFSPISFKDVLIILLLFLLIFLILPCGIYYYLIPIHKTMYLVITYVITVLVFGGLFVLINDVTKIRKRETMAEIKQIRISIHINNKKINKMRRSIKKDKDESTYGLQEFDSQIIELEEKLLKITDEKKEALDTFESSAKQAIEAEIWTRYEEELASLHQECKQAHRERDEYDEMQKELSMKISREYEAYLGKEFMSKERIDTLIEILENKGDGTISEALQIYKQDL